ncbi:MAG: helix-turn-helix domain-containing protein [Microthrixaceae bacterium]
MSTTTRPAALPTRRLMTISEVAALLGVDVRHVRRLVHEKRIPYIKWGHLLRFDPVEIAAWIDRWRIHPNAR